MLDTAGEVRTNSLVTFSNELLHMDTPVLAYQQKLIFTSFLQTLDSV